MTIIEQIKAEIDRLYGEYKDKFHQCGDQYHLGLIDGLDMAERVLDSLESEKPMQEGLEEEISRYLREECSGDDEPSISEIARHFAKWGAEHFRDTTKKIEPPCHTVEEWIEHIKNADQLTKDIFSMGPYDVLYDALNRPYRDCYDAIKEFGELCYQTARQDMMEEAVVYVAEPETPIGNILIPFIRIDHSVLFRYGIKVGDKVRVIVLPKED